MQRYMIHLKNQCYLPKDAVSLLDKARGLVSDAGSVVVRDSRVSKKYIEFDTSIPENGSIEDVIDRLTVITPLADYKHIIEKKTLGKKESLINARILFNDERYWEAHEILESVWKKSQGFEKDILNGIILVAAALVHDEKDESSICIAILKRAMTKLAKVNGVYFEIDLDKIKDQVSRILETGNIERFTI